MKRFICLLLALGLITGAFAGKDQVLKKGSIEIQLNDKPASALFARGKSNEMEEEVSGGNRIKDPEIDLTDEQYEFLAKHLVGSRKITLEHANELIKRNPYFQYTKYTSSTYLKHWPVEEIERDFMMHLAMAPAAVLEGSISAKTTEFTVTPYVFPENEITKWYIEEVRVKEEYLFKADGSKRSPNELIPIFPSSIKDGWSKNAREFIFFIRIGDELMRVDEWDVATGKVKVLRGFNGSTAVSHKKGDVVTSPIYNGNGPLAKTAIQFGGKQTERLESAKGKEDRELYYCSDKGPDNIPILERRAQEVLETMEKEGVQGAAMDVMSASLPMFKMVNALGLKTVPWDFSKNHPYSNADWVVGHDRMVGIIQRYVHEKTGRWPVIQANGVRNHSFEKGDGDGGYSKQLLIPTKLKPRPMESYHSEMGLAATGDNFPDQFRMMQIAFQESLAVSFAMKATFMARTQKEYDQTMVYGSAFYYMVYEPKNPAIEGTGPILRLSYLNVFSHLPPVGPKWTHPHGGLTYKVGFPYTFFLPLGKPIETHAPGDLDAYRYKDTNVFMRKYENGLVLINPTAVDGQWKFQGDDGAIDLDIDQNGGDGALCTPTSYKVKLDRRYIDSHTGEYVEGTITLPPISGKILLIQPEL